MEVATSLLVSSGQIDPSPHCVSGVIKEFTVDELSRSRYGSKAPSFGLFVDGGDSLPVILICCSLDEVHDLRDHKHGLPTIRFCLSYSVREEGIRANEENVFGSMSYITRVSVSIDCCAAETYVETVSWAVSYMLGLGELGAKVTSVDRQDTLFDDCACKQAALSGMPAPVFWELAFTARKTACAPYKDTLGRMRDATGYTPWGASEVPKPLRVTRCDGWATFAWMVKERRSGFIEVRGVADTDDYPVQFTIDLRGDDEVCFTLSALCIVWKVVSLTGRALNLNVTNKGWAVEFNARDGEFLAVAKHNPHCCCLPGSGVFPKREAVVSMKRKRSYSTLETASSESSDDE